MINNETREEFINSVYEMFSGDENNSRANQIIDMFDEATENCIELPANSNDNEIVGSTPEQPEITEKQLRLEWENYKRSDLEGLLILLPCKIGDIAYLIVADTIIERKVVDFRYDFSKMEFTQIGLELITSTGRTYTHYFDWKEIGKSIFIGSNAKENSENALKECKK